MTENWMLAEIAYNAAESLAAGNGVSLSPDERMSIAIGLAYEKAERRLPLEDASALYCDLDDNYPAYVAAVEAILSKKDRNEVRL